MADNTNPKFDMDQVRDLLSPYLDGEVTDEERALVEQAVATSPDLSWELESLRQTVALVSALPHVPATRPFTLSEADVKAVPRSSRRFLGLPAWVNGLAVAAATLLCVFAIGIVFFNRQMGGSQPAAEVAIAPQAAEPAEEQAAEAADEPAFAQEAAPPARVEEEDTVIELATAPEVTTADEAIQEAPAEEPSEGAVMEAEVAPDAAAAQDAAAGEESAAPQAYREETDAVGAAESAAAPAPTGTPAPVPTAAVELAAPQAEPAEEQPAAEMEQAAPAAEPQQKQRLGTGALAATPSLTALAVQPTSSPAPLPSPTATPTPLPTPTPQAQPSTAPAPSLTITPTEAPASAVVDGTFSTILNWLLSIGAIVLGAVLVITLLAWFIVVMRKRR